MECSLPSMQHAEPSPAGRGKRPRPHQSGRGQGGRGSSPSSSNIRTRIVCPDGDAAVEFTASPGKGESSQHHPAQIKYLIRVSSNALREASPYFRVFLDPEKFREGREFLEERARLDARYGTDTDMDSPGIEELPRIPLELPPVAGRFDKADLMEAFLKLLHLRYTETDVTETGITVQAPTYAQTQDALETLPERPTSFLASLVVLSDRFDGLQALNRALVVPLANWATLREYILSKTDRLLRSSRLLGDEGLMRLAIYLALFLRDEDRVIALTHRLIVDGSTEWVDGGTGEVAGIDKPIWWNLPNGIEEEMRFRHQAILNTISDLQSHFLRAYGAIPPEPVPAPPGSATTTTSRPRPKLQCRRMYANSPACDSFHLGEMIRFFSTRTKTLQLESTLSRNDEEEDDDQDTQQTPPPPQRPKPKSKTNIRTLIASLRECPEHQIDNNHVGCGLRRRLLPALDLLASFTVNSVSTVGFCMKHCDLATGKGLWGGRGVSGCARVQIGAGKVERVVYCGGEQGGKVGCKCVMWADLAREVFTAWEREWSA
ncbi:hypothetical protein FQN52_009471 [Onygenales sp. PD_12]|nr:hypothetical protein FQN52_009471 [Onygenales sp. PD_12]